MPVSTTAEQCMAEPDRPELDHVLFGVARDLIVRGDSPDLPRGWDRLRRQIRPGRRSFFTARASSERLTTDALDWWKSFAEGRIDVAECLTDLVERATGCLPSRATGCQPSPAAAVSHLTPASSARSGRRVPRATSLLGVTGLAAHVPRQHLADSHAPCRA